MKENNYNKNIKNIFIYKIGKHIKFEKEQKEYDIIDDYIYDRGHYTYNRGNNGKICNSTIH